MELRLPSEALLVTDGLIQEENVYSISEAIKIIKYLIKNKKQTT